MFSMPLFTPVLLFYITKHFAGSCNKSPDVAVNYALHFIPISTPPCKSFLSSFPFNKLYLTSQCLGTTNNLRKAHKLMCNFVVSFCQFSLAVTVCLGPEIVTGSIGAEINIYSFDIFELLVLCRSQYLY